MIRIISTTILAVSFMYSADAIDINKKGRDHTFMDKVQTADPDAQYELDQLKKEFEAKKNQINEKYDLKRKTLKKQQKQEVDNLRDAYKKRLKRLQSKYPKKIQKESRRHVKPLGKKDSKYLDPRKSDVNSKEERVKEKTSKESANPVKIKPKPRVSKDKK